ncbi:alkaline phosphatase [Chromobacterium sp. IIBBL 290-4]|uniref:alkaline phosphatase D family protein n=1 Tax=Chromobacterium sp. IIBBL 290-4 TaxID=2953890 RepID=UPI0020B6A632|nr:alkaline phosphatase D family protein [Chromobacterium sp. IIBBL 290-4]UTH75502.1 alkaline phosphatase D family protein [Chromobacterium sp. IIBBL 290-4]
MDRRHFLKWGSFLTVSVATGGLSACGGGGAGGIASTSTAGQSQLEAGKVFNLGVASGDPRPDSIVLWTRVAGGDGANPLSVTVQLSDKPDFSNLLVNQTLSADPSWDYTVRHKVTGLNSASTYYYRFLSGAGSASGRTKTAPAAGAPLSQLKFAYITCQDWSVNHWGAFDEIAQLDLDFVMHVGDYIYETVGAGFQTGGNETRHPPLTLPNGTKRADGAIYATTLADYRYLYKSYRADPRIQAVHANFPVISIWDDHEFSDDCWQDRQVYYPGEDDTPNTPRRRSASQAWFEYTPADVQLDLSNPSFQNIQIYRSFSFGNLATLVMTDQRLYRADHIISEDSVPNTGLANLGSRYFVPKNALATVEAAKIAAMSGDLQNVSILGDTQRNWWQQQMQSANTTWKLWGNEVSLLRMGVDGTMAVASLLAQGLIAALAQQGSNLSAAQQQLTGTFYQDLKAADVSGATPVLTYANTQGLLSVLTGGAISAPVFNAALKPTLDASLPPSMLLNQYILNADQWDGYNAERKALMGFLKSKQIGNVVGITGDIHAFFAGPVMDDFDAASPTPVMVDLVTAGISSNSFFSYFKNVVDTVPAFAKAAPLIYQTVNGQTVNTFTSTLQTFNPWLQYADTDAQGYAVVTLTPGKLSCVFHKVGKLVNGVAPSPATASTQTVEVVSGAPAVNVL